MHRAKAAGRESGLARGADSSQNTGMETRRYFAYGSNMSPEQMAERCWDAVPIGPAALTGWRFVINRRGVATLIPEPGTVVRGVLWTISATDEDALDRCEGVHLGRYGRREMTVHGPEGEAEALVYVDPDVEPGSPRKGYLERVVGGARAFGLPEAYVGELESWAR